MNDPVAHTPLGDMRGLDKHGVQSFRGIRYAYSTAGDGRFAPPRPVEGWTGVHDATMWGAIAPQVAGGLEALVGGGGSEQSEDCLFLNVWTPACDETRRPVMVWIHGGAFQGGAGSIPWYHGTELAKRDVVVVSLNYRLGALGFLHLADLFGDRFAGSGNVGIADQVAALQWVRDNIAAFGGDPDNVTIFGESAGAMSVGTLLAVPAATGLFHKAILQSGAASAVGDTASATDIARRLIDAAGLSGAGETTEATADALVALPLDELLAAQAKVGDTVSSQVGRLAWRPVVDGVVLPDNPLARVGAGAAGDVPLLIGTNLEEWRLFAMLDQAGDLDEGRLERRMAKTFPDDADRAAEVISCYRERLGASAKPLDVWVAAASDQVFRIPAIRLAERQSAHRDDTRMYLFTYRTPAFGGALGSCHALEIPFVFDGLDRGGVGMLVGPVVDRHRELATTMADAWVAFARTGEPAAVGMPTWPVYDTQRRATMRFDVDICEVVDDPMGAERELWESLAS